jgi:anti-sigma B factor antagonist
MAAKLPSIDMSTRSSANGTIVDVNGDITLRTTPDVRKLLLDLFREKQAMRVIVNLTNVRYIDSAGVASLVEALRISRDMEASFALFALSRAARQVLELTRLTKVFEIYETEEEAVRGTSTSAS